MSAQPDSAIELREKLKAALLARTKNHVDVGKMVRSAVLVPLFVKDGQYSMVLTRRTENLASHKGQISFPGGHSHKDEAALDTALRESKEEVGIRPADVEVIGELEDVVTLTTNFIIVPFLGVIPHPYSYKASKREVAEIIEVPLAVLHEQGCYRTAESVNEGNKYDWLLRFYDGRPSMACFYEFKGHVVWGATARIVKNVLDLAYGAD